MSEPVFFSMTARPVRQRSLLTHVSAVSAANSSGGGDKFSRKTSSNSSVGPASNPCARRSRATASWISSLLRTSSGSVAKFGFSLSEVKNVAVKRRILALHCRFKLKSKQPKPH